MGGRRARALGRRRRRRARGVFSVGRRHGRALAARVWWLSALSWRKDARGGTRKSKRRGRRGAREQQTLSISQAMQCVGRTQCRWWGWRLGGINWGGMLDSGEHVNDIKPTQSTLLLIKLKLDPTTTTTTSFCHAPSVNSNGDGQSEGENDDGRGTLVGKGQRKRKKEAGGNKSIRPDWKFLWGPPSTCTLGRNSPGLTALTGADRAARQASGVQRNWGCYRLPNPMRSNSRADKPSFCCCDRVYSVLTLYS